MNASNYIIHSIPVPHSPVLAAEDEDDLLQFYWAREMLNSCYLQLWLRGWMGVHCPCLTSKDPKQDPAGKLTAIIYGQLCHCRQNSFRCVFDAPHQLWMAVNVELDSSFLSRKKCLFLLLNRHWQHVSWDAPVSQKQDLPKKVEKPSSVQQL